MLKLLIITILLTTTVSLSLAQQNYNGSSVYRVTPTNLINLAQLKSLQDTGYDFWTGVRGVGVPVDILITPDQKENFINFIKSSQVNYEIFIKNIQELINNENNVINSKASGFNFKSYHRLDVIYEYLSELESKYKQVKVVQGGRSYEGRNITGAHLSYKSGNRAIFIEGGIHAREWIAPATVMYLLTELLTSKNPEVRYIAENYDWYFFPSVNPDGYEYTHAKSRLWRKTRQPYGTCFGADPNRNWDAHWLEAGSSSNACSDTHAGSKPFSEIETKSLSEFITKISKNLIGYIGFHSYSQLLLIPYGHTKEHLDNFDDLYEIGKKAVATIKSIHGKSYTPGNIVEVIYPASGGSMDWVKQEFKTPLTYTYELRDKGLYGFLLPSSQIIPTGEEILASLVTIVKEAEALEAGSSSNACSDTHAGSKPFSEIETKSLSEFITKISKNLIGYIGFHSYSQLLLIPYGHTKEHLDNFDDLYEISKKAVATIKSIHGKSYTPGNIVEVIYPASGGSMDWVKQEFKTPLTYTYELRDKGLYGFLLPSSQIIPTGEEILASLVTIVKEAEALGYE